MKRPVLPAMSGHSVLCSGVSMRMHRIQPVVFRCLLFDSNQGSSLGFHATLIILCPHTQMLPVAEMLTWQVPWGATASAWQVRPLTRALACK